MFSNHISNFFLFQKVFPIFCCPTKSSFPLCANNPSKVSDFFSIATTSRIQFSVGFSVLQPRSAQRNNYIMLGAFALILLSCQSFSITIFQRKEKLICPQKKKNTNPSTISFGQVSFITESCKDIFRQFNFQIYILQLKWFTKPHKNLHGKGEEQEQNYIQIKHSLLCRF